MAIAIKDMHVRGAGLIGAATGYGMYLAARQAARSLDETSSASSSSHDRVDKLQEFQSFVTEAGNILLSTRPTAVNLEHAVNRQKRAMDGDFFKPVLK